MHGSSLMSFTCGKLANYPFALGSIKSKLMLSMCLLIALGLHYSLALGSINSFFRALIYAWTREETAGRETGQRLNECTGTTPWARACRFPAHCLRATLQQGARETILLTPISGVQVLWGRPCLVLESVRAFAFGQGVRAPTLGGVRPGGPATRKGSPGVEPPHRTN